MNILIGFVSYTCEIKETVTSEGCKMYDGVGLEVKQCKCYINSCVGVRKGEENNNKLMVMLSCEISFNTLW